MLGRGVAQGVSAPPAASKARRPGSIPTGTPPSAKQVIINY